MNPQKSRLTHHQCCLEAHYTYYWSKTLTAQVAVVGLSMSNLISMCTGCKFPFASPSKDWNKSQWKSASKHINRRFTSCRILADKFGSPFEGRLPADQSSRRYHRKSSGNEIRTGTAASFVAFFCSFRSQTCHRTEDLEINLKLTSNDLKTQKISSPKVQ